MTWTPEVGTEETHMKVTEVSSFRALIKPVESVDHGRAAVDYIQKQDVDLVILDMIMAGDFDGLDTYNKIIETRPNQRCIIARGFSESARAKEALHLGVAAYVQKPYTLAGIAGVIRQVLDA